MSCSHALKKIESREEGAHDGGDGGGEGEHGTSLVPAFAHVVHVLLQARQDAPDAELRLDDGRVEAAACDALALGLEL